jgi:catechol 2,3-dioxygenase-like lactoylglutathione lyase family enzyme
MVMISHKVLAIFVSFAGVDCVLRLIFAGVSVDDLDAACKRFEELGVNWKKRLTDGRMKNVAFVLDPDNYWIEIIQNEKLKGRANW